MNDLERSGWGLKSLAKQKVQHLTPEQLDKRKDRGKQIHHILKNGLPVCVLGFSDEKDFTVGQHHCRCEDSDIVEAIEGAAPQLKYRAPARPVCWP